MLRLIVWLFKIWIIIIMRAYPSCGRIPVVVQDEIDSNAEACGPSGYEAVWSSKPLHEGVQLALCIGTSSKDINLNDGDRIKRGFCRPVDVRPDLLTPPGKLGAAQIR